VSIDPYESVHKYFMDQALGVKPAASVQEPAPKRKKISVKERRDRNKKNKAARKASRRGR